MSRLLAAGAAASIAVTVAATAASFWWVFDLFTHFRVQLVVGQALLTAALLFTGRRGLGAVVAACALLHILPLGPYVWPVARAAPGAATIAVLAANVEARNDSYAGLLASIEQTRPDVVLLVEYTSRWGEHIAVLGADYPHQFRVPRSDNFGMALLSRHPLTAVRARALGATFAIDAELASPDGTLRFIGVHLVPPVTPRSAHERNAQLAALAEIAATVEGPLVIAGDFNVSPYSPHFAALLKRTRLTDARAGRGLDITWPTYMPLLGIPIDHCLVSEKLAVSEYRRLARFGSDHYPIFVSLVHERTT